VNIAIPGISAALLYLLTTALLARNLTRGAEANARLQRGLLLPTVGAWLLHAFVLYQLVVSQWITLGFFHALSASSWLLVGLILIARRGRTLDPVGIVVYPIASLTLLLELRFPEPIKSSAASAALDSHILFSMLAYSLLGIAALLAVLLLIQDRQLRNKHPGGFMRALPPLAQVETLMFRVLQLGFVLLSIALVTGFVFLEDLFAQHLAHKTVLSLLSWLLFASLLWGHLRHGWRGRHAVRWLLGGYVALLIGYFGSKFVLEVLLTQ
jgi:ABC-type uncharacterized transport system permease subunit